MPPPRLSELPQRVNPPGPLKVTPLNSVPKLKLFVLASPTVPAKTRESPGNGRIPPAQLALLCQKRSPPAPVHVWVPARAWLAATQSESRTTTVRPADAAAG